MSGASLFAESGALFSPCRTYRYRLWRTRGDGKSCLFVMLNPSTADDTSNDPTVEHCERRARAWGYNRLEVVNLFALRSTDPAALKAHDDPVGPDNDLHVRLACLSAGLVICAWGVHGKLYGRGAAVLSILQAAGVEPRYLRLSRGGEPAHPLYLPYDLAPKPLAPAPPPGEGAP